MLLIYKNRSIKTKMKSNKLNMHHSKKKVLIFIISYKASFRVRDVFNEIPFKKLKNYNIKTLISDDCSNDDTIKYAKILKKQKKNIYINQNKKNLGYGGHIKKCLNYAIKNKFHYAVMIHGDGQYSPKYIPNLLNILNNNYNICSSTGSRILKGIRKVYSGGMPFYKLVGNIILTKIFNILMRCDFTDTHTGLWAYNLSFFKDKEFNYLTNSYNFDQDFRVMSLLKKRNIKEIPIQTKYGDERSQLHFKYAIKFFLNTLLFFCVRVGGINSKKFK